MEVKIGAFLVPTSTPLGDGGESGLDFVDVLGGDKDTLILLVSSPGEPDIIKGMPVGANGFFKPRFVPSWEKQQLIGEITRGVWKYVAPDNPEFPVMIAEMDKRIMLNRHGADTE